MQISCELRKTRMEKWPESVFRGRSEFRGCGFLRNRAGRVISFALGKYQSSLYLCF